MLVAVGAVAESNNGELSSKSDVILTYQATSPDIPAIGLEKDCVYFKFPTSSHPERIRGDNARCSIEGDETIWSFAKPDGMNPELKQRAGRVELMWRPAEPVAAKVTTSSSKASSNLTNSLLQPIIAQAGSEHEILQVTQDAASTSPGTARPKARVFSSSDQAGEQQKNEARFENQSINWANLDLSVPESPAFAALGVVPETVTRPGSPREFATQLLNGVDKNGNFQNGLAFDTAPYLLFFGDHITLHDYETSAATRFLSRTQFSFATSKGADDDKSTRLALDLRFTFFDNGDPRLDQKLLSDFAKAFADAGGHEPIGFGPEADAQIADVGRRFHEGVVAARARREAERRDWNASSWSLGLAPTWINRNGISGSFEWNGGAVWTSFAYGFEQVPVLQDKAQFIAELRYRNHEEIPDPNERGSFFRQDSLTAGARLRIGAPDFNTSFDGALVQEWPDKRHSDSAGRCALNVERRIAKNLWLTFSLGKEFGHEDGKNPVLALGTFKFGYSDEAAPINPLPVRTRGTALTTANRAETTLPPAVGELDAAEPPEQEAAANPKPQEVTPVHSATGGATSATPQKANKPTFDKDLPELKKTTSGKQSSSVPRKTAKPVFEHPLKELHATPSPSPSPSSSHPRSVPTKTGKPVIKHDIPELSPKATPTP